VRALRLVLEGKKARLIREMEAAMKQASEDLQFERAARLRDDIDALQNLGKRGDVDRDVQPEVFPLEPRKGMVGLRKILGLAQTPRTIEGIDIAHLGGNETVASLVAFIDGLPFKPGYRRYRIRSVEGVDDFASIREVVTRRFRRLARAEEVFPDILLIDGGKGQLNAALEAFRLLAVEPPCLISLAKREEEIYRPGEAEPLRLSRHAAALRLLQYVRDEAHRFAQHYHHILRRRKFTADEPAKSREDKRQA
jgi:excinuclease ABC subunit C